MKRVWEGYKECCTTPYYVGQEFITEGRLKGSYRTVTHEFETYDEALSALDNKCDKKDPS